MNASALTLLSVLLTAAVAAAAPAPEAPAAPQEGMIELNFPEQLDLKALIDYVSRRNGVNFLYDANLVANRQVTLLAPRKIPADSLMALLESVLSMNGMTLQPTAAGMLRIEMARPLPAISGAPRPIDAAAQARQAEAVTSVVSLAHATPSDVEAVLRPFLSSATANVTLLPQHRMMIITDHAGNMRRLADLVALIDRPAREVSVQFVPIENLKATEMVGKVQQVVHSRASAGGAGAAAASILADERTNRLIVIGSDAQVEQAVALAKSLDVPLGLTRKMYTFKIASAARVDRLARELIGELAAGRLYKAAVDAEANLLIVTATDEIHRQLEALREEVDKPVGETQSPVRFYKLQNAKAADVLATLQTIEGDEGLGGVSVDGVAAQRPPQERLLIEGPTPDQVNNPVPSALGKLDGQQRRPKAVQLRDARIMADEPSNTIIVIAAPAMHAVYEKLIERLDIRRPQVHVTGTVVALDTTDGFSLGVEIGHKATANGGEATVLNFSSFGLSTVNAETGRLAIKPGVGFNGALISADIADVVIRALKTDQRARVISRPSLLINDNATGTLVSETEEPYESVNATNTVATTSFAGYTSAGTKMKITPQISQGDHLKLEFEITLSSFGEDASDVLPPSRQSNTLASEATIPDGHTIVVGGLSREDFINTVNRVPLLGEIPGLEYLFSSRVSEKRQVTLFVFIRAVILRDDEFRDLKMISGEAARQAAIEEDYPDSEPVEMRSAQGL